MTRTHTHTHLGEHRIEVSHAQEVFVATLDDSFNITVCVYRIKQPPAVLRLDTQVARHWHGGIRARECPS